MQYYLSLSAWNEESLEIFINFTNPQVVSQGINQDAFVVKIKYPNMFVSQQSGFPLRAEDAVFSN